MTDAEPMPHHHLRPPDHDVRRLAIAESIRGGLWFVPLLFVLGAIVLAMTAMEIDRQDPSIPLLFGGDASSAQTLLSTVAASTLTMTTLVLSITIVALQLASQQFSPRVMRAFFRDTGTKVSLGIFLATTVYAFVALRAIVPEGLERQAFVPRLTVSGAVLLTLCSLATFVYYLNHVAHSIRVVHIMDAVAAETRAAIRHQAASAPPLAAGEWPDRAPDAILVSAMPPGALLGVDEDDLVELAEVRGARIRMIPTVGAYLPSGSPLFEVWSDDGEAPRLHDAELCRYVGLGRERTMYQDVAFGIRQLVDIAVRAMSPAVNDPMTAVQSIGRLSDLLHRLARLPDASGVHRGRDGVPRLVVPMHGWDEFVRRSVDEIRRYGADSITVHRALRRLLIGLEPLVADRPERLEVIALELAMLDRAAAVAFPEAADRLRVGAPE